MRRVDGTDGVAHSGAMGDEKGRVSGDVPATCEAQTDNRPAARNLRSEATRRWQLANPEQAREAKRKYRRKLRGAVDASGAARTGACELCSAEGALVWDHCHVSGQFRGWLCNACNRGLGAFRDDPERLERAAAYLRRCQAPQG